MFIEQQICILEWFLKDHVKMNTIYAIYEYLCWNFALITGIKYILKYIKKESNYCNNFNCKKYLAILLLCLYFGSNKCRFGEQKRIL